MVKRFGRAIWSFITLDVVCYAIPAFIAIWFYMNGGSERLSFVAHHAIFGYILAWWGAIKIWQLERRLNETQKALDDLRKRNG